MTKDDKYLEPVLLEFLPPEPKEDTTYRVGHLFLSRDFALESFLTVLPAACVSQSDRLLRSYLLITSDYTLKTRSGYDREIKIETWKRAEIPGLASPNGCKN